MAGEPNLAIVLGIFATAIGSTATANTSAQIQFLAQAEGDNPGKIVVPAIKIDGSSTVYPITQAIVKLFEADSRNKGQVEAKFSGTTGGFEKFCAGKTDINDA